MKPDPIHIAAHAVRLLLIAAAAMPGATAFAKLPPLTEEAKSIATENAAKSAWADKVGLLQLCTATDRIAGAYRKRAAADGKTVPPAVATPECAHPGAYVSPITPASSKPLESAGAHSPPSTAVSPPSTKVPSAEIDKGVRK